jgi:hypothetical protein
MPGEIKSFIVRDNAVEPGDLERTRLQAAVEILALRAEFEIHKAGKLIGNGAGFVFSTPYGLKPAPIVIEELDGPLSEITRARDALKRTSVRLEHLTVPEKARLENIAAELAINYQEKCVSTCALSDVCGSRYRGTARQLGDAAATILGPDTELSRLEQLLAGATPLTQKEQIQAAALQRVARSLRVDPTLIARSQVA